MTKESSRDAIAFHCAKNDRVLFGGDRGKASQHRACSLSLKSL
ncbi:MAG: hypothetical protein AB4426_17905 [Xenococcaceae cyanobacterium]